MQVTVTLTFNDMWSYECWLQSQTGGIQAMEARNRSVPTPQLEDAPAAEAAEVAVEVAEAVPDMPGGATQTEAVALPRDDPGTPAKKPRKPRKPRAPKKDKPAQTAPITEQEVLPVAPVATEAAPAEGEKVYTLADSREVLTAYLAKPGNGAETLIKELSVHKAKRINEVPQEHIHGFLKRMVEAS